MRLRHIEIFSAIISTGSAAGAARLLHISQPAVSKMLQHAEQSLGFALFLRDKGKLVPTPEALRLREELGPFEDQIRRIRRLASNLARGAIRPLRVAVTPAIAHSVLPQAIAAWCQAFPNSECKLSVSHTCEIEHALLLGEAELGLTMQPVSHPNVVATPVCESHLRAIAPAGWWPPERLDQPLTPDELANVPLISIDADDYLGAMLANWLADVDQGPVSQISVQTYPIARALVEQHIGVALVDSFTASHCPGKGNIQNRPLATSETLRVYALAERSRPPVQMANRLIHFLREASR